MRIVACTWGRDLDPLSPLLSTGCSTPPPPLPQKTWEWTKLHGGRNGGHNRKTFCAVTAGGSLARCCHYGDQGLLLHGCHTRGVCCRWGDGYLHALGGTVCWLHL